MVDTAIAHSKVSSGPDRRSWLKRKLDRKSTTAFLMTLPLIVLIAVLVIYPALYAIHLATLNKRMTEFVGFKNGWKGVIDGDTIPLGRPQVMGISKQGGTILGSSRTNPFDFGGAERVAEVMAEGGVDSLIAIGGEGTLAAANRLADAGIPIVGVPKTIDNDLSATDYTFGFDTAVQIATDAMDRLRTTGDSHGRCMVAEVMGRHVGWIALHSGMAAGAHAILIPEQKTSIEQIIEWVEGARDRGRAPAGKEALRMRSSKTIARHLRGLTKLFCQVPLLSATHRRTSSTCLIVTLVYYPYEKQLHEVLVDLCGAGQRIGRL